MSEHWLAALPSPPYHELTYRAPGHLPALARGMRVLAPLGRGLRVAVLTGPCPDPDPNLTLKDLIWPLDRAPLLDEAYLDLARDLAARQMVSLGRILELALPRGLRTVRLSFALENGPLPARLGPRDLAGLGAGDLSSLTEAWNKGRMYVRRESAVRPGQRVVSLASDPPWAVRPNARRRIELLERLYDHGPASLDSLRRALGPWSARVASDLARAGLAAIRGPALEDAEDPPEGLPPDEPDEDLVLSPDQARALEGLFRALDEWSGRIGLVHGVTGSGKTHIYLELAARCLAAGRSTLLLAPEVALAWQLFRQARKRFPGAAVSLYHGYQSPKARERAFLASPGTGPAVVVGTRSALFLPLPDLGLVVVDEEHDESFKQEERLSYQAKEVAFSRVKRVRGMLVLGSATPDLKTFHAAESGLVPKVSLTHRVGDSAGLPEVELVDISGLRDPEKPFAEATLAALAETVDSGGQAMVMLNRRGYAPLMYCLDCGQAIRCPDCRVGMTFHKRRERLVCHYCGLTYPYPLLCPGCGGSQFLPMGEGTERLEETLKKTLPPSARVLRMDRDSARRQERLEEILGAFGRGEAQVLVGTQMLSKGHHFPGVTLVVAADADLGLNLPDYRASERAFQLLVQVSGRAGRGGAPGRVLIQTRNPGLEFWRFVLAGDYLGFYGREIALRQKYRYPPFVKLGLIRIDFPVDWEPGPGRLAEIGAAARRLAANLGVQVLGPAPAPLGLLRGRRRYHCLVKSGDWPGIRALFHGLAGGGGDLSGLRLNLDLDPVSML
ncbi:MAG: primosomal protein N' [Desulfovibrionaceae bacterium]|nr:primosomal protein N' [Desulfovibrionaceae bacterium]